MKDALEQKVFLGFSDTTTNHFMLQKLGLPSFYGQAFLPDVCELGSGMLPYSRWSFEELLATRQIREVYPDLKIIVMSGFDEISYAPRAKEAGADAFVYKSKSMAFFLEIIQKVLAGEQWFPEPRTIPLPKGEAPLTARAMEILRLICQYRTRNEIARELFIQPDTVKYHVSNMLAKTGCSTTAELAILMIGSGWINPRY